MKETTKKARKPSRERMPITGSALGAIEGAIDTLTGLRDEFQEIVDNASEGLQQTERHQTREATVDALSFVDDGLPDIPEAAGEVSCSWVENQHPKASRAARCANAVSALESARDAIQNWIDDTTERADKLADKDAVVADDAADEDELRDQITEAEEAVNTLEEWIGSAQDTEWPGMFG